MVTMVFILTVVSKNVEHFLGRLFFTVYVVNDVALGIPVYDHMFGGWNQAVFDASVSADGILVSSCMEKSQVKGLLVTVLYLGSSTSWLRSSEL